MAQENIGELKFNIDFKYNEHILNLFNLADQAFVRWDLELAFLLLKRVYANMSTEINKEKKEKIIEIISDIYKIRNEKNSSNNNNKKLNSALYLKLEALDIKLRDAGADIGLYFNKSEQDLF